MLLCEAGVHEKNGKTQEAAKIREWVANFLCEQSKFVSPLWGPLPKPMPTTLNAIGS
jgi:hypothetical protein